MLTSFLWTVTELSKPSNWPSSETNTLACPGSSCEQCLWTCHASEQCSPGCQMFPSRPRLTHPPTDTYHRDLIHVGLVVQQESRTVQVVTLGCHVQRGQSILKKILHMVLFFVFVFLHNGRQCATGQSILKEIFIPLGALILLFNNSMPSAAEVVFEGTITHSALI